MGSCPTSLERFSVDVHERCDTSNTCYLLPVSVKKKTKTFRIALLRGRPPSPPDSKLISQRVGAQRPVKKKTHPVKPHAAREFNFEFGGHGGRPRNKAIRNVFVFFFTDTGRCLRKKRHKHFTSGFVRPPVPPRFKVDIAASGSATACKKRYIL